MEEKNKQLKERITNVHSPNYFFKQYYDNLSTPVECFGLYMQSVWNKILNNRNNSNFSIDLSDCKLMIINFMFENFKNQVYKEILVKYLMKIKKDTMDNKYFDLSNVAQEIFQKSQTLYNNLCQNYFKTQEYYSKEMEIYELIKQDLLEIFKKQIIMLKKASFNEVNELIRKENLSCKNNYVHFLI